MTSSGRTQRLGLSALLGLMALLLLAVPSALAAEPPNELTRLGGVSGPGAGQLGSAPGSSAADPTTGQIYVDGGNNRIDEFSPWGEFIKAFGWNVAPGAVNEQQEVRLRAAAGTFKLSFEAAVTPDLPFDASAAEVRLALDGLSTIGGAGGEVSVSEHPGSATTETPFIWTITFKGALGATDVPQVGAEEGTTPLSGGAPATGIEARTRADGFAAGHVGLEACTTESGCQEGVRGPRVGQLFPGDIVVGPSGDVFIEDSFDNFEMPLHRRDIQEFDPAGRFLREWGGDTIADGAAGTGVLAPGSTEIASVVTTEKVFRVGQPIEGVGIEAGTTIAGVGSGAIELSNPATAAATGAPTPISSPEGPRNVASNETQTIALSPNVTGGVFALGFTTPRPSPGEARTGAGGTAGELTKGSNVVSKVSTSWGSFEVGEMIVAENSAGEQYLPKGTTITAVGPETLTLSQPALSGSERGVSLTTATIPWNASAAEIRAALLELANIEPGDVEVTGPTGGPWKVEFEGARYGGSDVEALEPKGPNQTLTTSGGEAKVTVTSANAAEICEAAVECQGGAEGIAQGQFDGSPQLALSPAGQLVVADSHPAGLVFDSRVQGFSTEGAFESEVTVPGEQVTALAAAPSGDKLYAIYKGSVPPVFSTKDIHLLDPSSGAEIGTWELEDPVELATDPAGNLWVVVGQPWEGHPARIEHVAEFDADGNQLLPNQAEEESCIAPEEEGHGSCQFFAGVPPNSASHPGLGSGAAGDIFVSNRNGGAGEGYVTVYGPPPVEFESPPFSPPSIEAQFAVSVDTIGAEVSAQINPHFWADTTYYLEYGTQPCSEGGCVAKPAAPGALLREGVTSAPLRAAPIVLGGLRPGTTYHYRFVAQSSGGGPIVGRGGTEAEAGEEATFTTPRETGTANGCGNEAFRTGASAALPDCRAYEMVSPVDKEGADVLVVRGETFSQPLQQASASGGRLVFPSRGSFGDDPSAPYTSQYLAARGPSGWSTHSLNPPQDEYVPNAGVQRLNSEFFAFSPDLCQAWYESQSDPPLAEGAPAGYRDLYRRADQECGGTSYEPMNTLVPSSWPPYQHGFQMGFEGASANGTRAFFIANDKLASGGIGGVPQLYVHAQGDPQARLVCVLPNGKPLREMCSAGESSAGGLSATELGFSNGKVLAHLQGAVAEDGSRVYWSAGYNGTTGEVAKIYLRENPAEPQSALAHGAAAGTGRLTNGSDTVTSLVAARGKAELVEGSARITLDETTIGEFVAGQPITGSGIPAGTTVDSVEGATLTLSQAVEAGRSGSERTVTSRGPMPFDAGQSISAPGIPDGTTVVAVSEGTLTLSAKATVTKAGVPLAAISECTEATKGCTIPVSQEAEQESGSEGSFFRAAAADGSRAVFLNGDRVSGRGLYEFRLAGQATHKIAGEVLGVMGASKDAERVYFVSEEDLASEAVAGERNLYLYDAGADSYALVAVLGSQDFGQFYSPLGDIEGPESHMSRVSADGLHAAFMSFGRPTDYDNTDLSSGRDDSEVYVYSAAANGGAGKLVCASCNPSGARPRGRGLRQETAIVPLAGQIPGYESSFYATRVLSEDGRRLFFESYDALLPSDTNGALDVYEWEAPGSGSCGAASAAYSARNGGCIYLISTGKSPGDSNFVDASPSGADAFFITEESLVPQDRGLRDVYDARVGGGFPPPAGRPPACEGEGCQPTLSAPNDKTPASAGFHGAGNVAPVAQPRCRKGQRRVRRKGKTHCIKRRKVRHRRHARHHRHARHRRRGRRSRSANRDRGGRR